MTKIQLKDTMHINVSYIHDQCEYKATENIYVTSVDIKHHERLVLRITKHPNMKVSDIWGELIINPSTT